MSAFKVATFDFAKEESPPPQAVTEPAAMELAAEPKQFWEQLLKPGFEDIKSKELQSLGKGRRERKQVQYLISCRARPVPCAVCFP